MAPQSTFMCLPMVHSVGYWLQCNQLCILLDAFADGIPIPALVLPFNCLFEDWTNGTSFCMTLFSLGTGTTIHLHGIRQGYYFLRLSAYVPGGIASADELVNITGSGNYYVTATYMNKILSFTSLTPGMQVTTP